MMAHRYGYNGKEMQPLTGLLQSVMKILFATDTDKATVSHIQALKH